MEETRAMNADDIDEIRANISKTMAETMKIGAETAKIQAESRYYPVVASGAIIVSAVGAATAIIVKLFFYADS